MPKLQIKMPLEYKSHGSKSAATSKSAPNCLILKDELCRFNRKESKFQNT
jgi:hypothetical protein